MKIHNSMLCALLVSFVLAAALFLQRRPSKPARPLCLEVFIDESTSMTRPILDDGRSVQQLGMTLLDDVIDNVVPPRSPVQAWAFSSPTMVRSIWNGAPLGAEDILPLQQWVHSHPRGGEGTYALPALSQSVGAAKEAAARNQDVLVILISDAEWNDTDKLAPQADELAAMPNVRGVVVVPVSVEGEYRSRLEAVLRPLGERAVVANKTDIEQVENRMRRLIRR